MKRAQKEKLNAIFCVAHEMVKDNGEDCYYYATAENSAIIASFDGCGGSGSKRYNNYSGKTGAYVGSRAVCGGVKSWFETTNKKEEELKAYIDRALRVLKKYEDNVGRLMGSLGKSFPTTAAILYTKEEAKEIQATAFWAGDSRCYMMNEQGLHQLSMDDLGGEDAFTNLSSDAVMTNVISAGSAFELHCETFRIKQPCIFFTATDGCFGYLNSPMAFEYMLLETLMRAESLEEWKQSIDDSLGEVAGDDYTLCVSIYGFESFNDIKTHLVERRNYILQRYMHSVADLETQWAEYRCEYESYLK